MNIIDVYRGLFGRKGIEDGNVIDMAEHGRVGGVSTGQPFKFTVPIDPDTGDTLTPTPAITGYATSAKQDTGNASLATIAATDFATEAKQDDIIGELEAINSLVPDVYDYISLSYTGDNLTGVVFKVNGSGGTTVSTLTLAYSGSNLTGVTKS